MTQRIVHGVPVRMIRSEWVGCVYFWNLTCEYEVHNTIVDAPQYRIVSDDVVSIRRVRDGEYVVDVRLRPGLINQLKAYGACPVNLQPNGDWIVDGSKLADWFVEAFESGHFEWT